MVGVEDTDRAAGDEENDLNKISYTAASATATAIVPYSGSIVPHYSFRFFAIRSCFFVPLCCSSYPLFFVLFSVYVSFSFLKPWVGYLCSG